MATIPSEMPQSATSRAQFRGVHLLLGLLVALGASGFAFLIASTAQQRLPDPSILEDPHAVPAVPNAVRPIAPESVEVYPDSTLIYAGHPIDLKPDAAPAITPVTGSPDAAPAAVPMLPELITIPPDVPSPWTTAQLPADIPRQAYTGWVRVVVDEGGLVTKATITESTGNTAVDEASLARLTREPLTPAVEIQADESRVPVAWSGPLFISWIDPAGG